LHLSPPGRIGRFLADPTSARLVLLLLFSPLFLFPSPGRAWFLLLLPGILIFQGLLRGRIIERTILDVAILVLLFQTLLTCAVVPDIGFSLGKIAGIVFGVIAFYVLMENAALEGRCRFGVRLFMAAGLAVAVFGLFGMTNFEKEAEKQLRILTRIRGLIPQLPFRISGAEEGLNTNALAGTLLLVFPLLVVFFLFSIKRKEKTLFFISIIAISFVLALTLSRGAWAAVLVSGLLGIPLIFRLRGKSWLPGLMLAGISIIVLVFGYVILVGGKNLSLSERELYSKAGGRTQAWSVGLEAIRQKPLTGVGLNRIRLDPGIGYKRAHVHNHMIQTAAELGLPALVALLAIYFGIGTMCVQVWRRGKDPWQKKVIFGLGWGQLAYAFFGITDSITLGAKAGIFFWISLALIAAVHRQVVRIPKTEER
jgi:hypothetical protein